MNALLKAVGCGDCSAPPQIAVAVAAALELLRFSVVAAYKQLLLLLCHLKAGTTFDAAAAINMKWLLHLVVPLSICSLLLILHMQAKGNFL